MNGLTPEQSAYATQLAELLHERDEMPRHLAIVEAQRVVLGGEVEVTVLKIDEPRDEQE